MDSVLDEKALLLFSHHMTMSAAMAAPLQCVLTKGCNYFQFDDTLLHIIKVQERKLNSQ